MSAISGTIAGTSSNSSPVNGQTICLYSGCSDKKSVPRTDRKGMKGRPWIAARNCCTSV